MNYSKSATLILLLVIAFSFWSPTSSRAYFLANSFAEVFRSKVEIPYVPLVLEHRKDNLVYYPREIITPNWQTSGVSDEDDACKSDSGCFYLSGDPSSISQTFELSSEQPSTLSFSIKTSSEEVLLGFDRPYFRLSIDGTTIYEEYFSNDLPMEVWREVYIPLPSSSVGKHTLKFSQQSTGDKLLPTNAMVKNISTNSILLGGEDQLIARWKDGQELQMTSLARGVPTVSLATSPFDISLESIQAADKLTFKVSDSRNDSVSVGVRVVLEPPVYPEVLHSAVEDSGDLTLVLVAENNHYLYEAGKDVGSEVWRSPFLPVFNQRQTIIIPAEFVDKGDTYIRAIDLAANSSEELLLNW